MYPLHGRTPRRTDAESDRFRRQKKVEYLKAVLRVIGESSETASAAELVEDISKVYESFFGKEKDIQRSNMNIMKR